MKLPAEQEHLRHGCGHPAGGFIEFPVQDVEQSIAARFEGIVRLYPDRLAVKQGDLILSYDRLNRAANRVAHLILSLRGAGAEPVGLYLSDQLAMVVTLLGILKAGKFFLPLDPSFPQSRNLPVAKDCGAAVIVTERLNLAAVAELFGKEYRTVAVEDAEASRRDDDLEIPAVTPCRRRPAIVPIWTQRTWNLVQN